MRFGFIIEPPFNDRSAAGDVVGCDVELAAHVADVLGEAFEPIETQFAQMLPGLVDERWDMTTGLFETPERRKMASFTRPIWALPDGLLVPSENPLGLSGYRSAAATGARLGVLRDQIQHNRALANGVPPERLVVGEDYEEMAALVVRGDVDAYASVLRAHEGFLIRTREQRLGARPVPVAEAPASAGAFAVRRGDSERLAATNAALLEHVGSAAHRAAMERWGFRAVPDRMESFAPEKPPDFQRGGHFARAACGAKCPSAADVD
ncbi:MAG: transporter substrate-binding domain-containing protein, partial [Pseudomonadota bacterium]